MSNEVMVKDIDAITWQTMKEQANMLVKSGFLPKAVDTPEKAMAIAMKGRELGIPMMQSITSINVIDGKPTISAELMAALVLQRISGAVLRCVETSNTICTYEAGRPGDKILKMSFTWDDAIQAGVTNKNNWKNYPAAMLRARCCSAICRIVFPDAIMGCYTPDELGAITTEDSGEILDITPNKPAGKPPVQQPQSKSEQTAPTGTSIIDIITDVETATGKNKETGKPWTKYGIKAGGFTYGTFDKALADMAEQFKGCTVKILFEQKGKFLTCTSIQEIVDAEVAPEPSE